MRKFFGDKSGAIAIEYGLIAALVSVAAIGYLVIMDALKTTPGDNVDNVPAIEEPMNRVK